MEEGRLPTRIMYGLVGWGRILGETPVSAGTTCSQFGTGVSQVQQAKFSIPPTHTFFATAELASRAGHLEQLSITLHSNPV